MKVKLILPALIEAKSPFWRPIKYSLFPPLGLATLAAFLNDDDDVELLDEHVEAINLNDAPDLVIIQVYITNAYRAYALADHYRARGAYVILGGLHVTSQPSEAALHADSIFLGPGEDTFPAFLNDFRHGIAELVYFSSKRDLHGMPRVRRDLIKRELYLVPNSLVVSRGCPHHCNFCYKDSFYQGGKSFYTQRVDEALAQIEALPGKHLYFLDDHLLADRRFATQLFDGMKGMGRLFQAASTVDAVLRDDLIDKAMDAGLRSLFIGFETLDTDNLSSSNKRQNIGRDYNAVVDRLANLDVMINGSFVFGLDSDDKDVFKRTVEWGVEHGLTTSTYHILTPYPGTALFNEMQLAGRISSRDWSRYTTRDVVYQPRGMSADDLRQGYDWAYKNFYSWKNIARSSSYHLDHPTHAFKQFAYSAGWKKFEPLWNTIIKTKKIGSVIPALESVLKTSKRQTQPELKQPLQNSEAN